MFIHFIKHFLLLNYTVVGARNVYYILLYFLYNAQKIRVTICIPIDSRKMVAYIEQYSPLNYTV